MDNSLFHDHITTSVQEKINAMLGTCAHIAITGHKFPDGDAVGSALALRRLLTNLGKRVDVLLPKSHIGNPQVFEDFDTITDIREYDFSKEPDMFICLDCAEPLRICDKRMQHWIGKIPTVNIDHHGKVLFGDVNYVIKDYSSTGELVFNLAKAFAWPLDRQSAESLWVSIVTDTDRFIRGVQSSTFLCAAELLSLGVRATWLNDELFMQEPANVFELRRRAINSLEQWCANSVAVITLTLEDFSETQCTKQDTADFPNIPLSVKGSKLAIFIYPLPGRKNETRISLRSRQGAQMTARQIAEHFGGAGHEHSAGALYFGTVFACKKAVRSFIENKG